ASARLDLWLGAINTAILLTSSLVVAIGVEAREKRPRRTAPAFLGGALLGLAFLAVKAFEYAQDYHEHLMPGTAIGSFSNGPERLFIDLYFVATGLHALHVTIGVVLLGAVAWRASSSNSPTGSAIENVGLYWHLVDVIWVFLYPMFYLMRG
ncbi:MAG: cytochrome c oxidase polypeptide III, partial [Rhizobiaceae bacterium]